MAYLNTTVHTPRTSFSSSRCPSPGISSPTVESHTTTAQTHHRPAFVHATTTPSIPHINVNSPLHSSIPASLHSSTSSTSTTSSSTSTNATTDSDYPIKSESIYPSSDGGMDHRIDQHLTSNPNVRGMYNHRRTPSTFDGILSIGRSRSEELKEKLFPKEGGIGRWLIAGWVVTTLGFLVMIGCYRGELFTALDQLSKSLSELGFVGQLIFGLLIFTTTIPPLPLYSTLIVLSGYTFGAWNGFVVSYLASLIGAVVVFVVSRGLLRDVITRCLAGSPMAMTLLQIIPHNPHLLLLIRIAPYPYNLLNVILASSPALTLKTYTSCTAISLCKLILHTWIGAGIHDLSIQYRSPPSDSDTDSPESPDFPSNESPSKWRPYHRPHRPPYYHHPHPGHMLSAEEIHRQTVKTYTTWAGIVLCVGLFFYLTHMAKKALAAAQAEQEARERDDDGVGLLERSSDEEEV